MTQQTLDATPHVTFHEKPYRHYKVNGLKVPSVTQVIGLLDKPALKHWAQREAVNGVAALARQYGADDAIFRNAERLEHAILQSGREINAQTFVELYTAQDCSMPWDQPHNILRLLKQSEESINAAMKRAQQRGVAIHEVWETYAKTGELPDVEKFPEEHHGYLRATAAFITKFRPKFTQAEVVVGSAQHEFGGRLDFLAHIERGDQFGLLDLKTNAKGRVYLTTHSLQVEAYGLAARECGIDTGDFRAIVAIGADGSYELKRSIASEDDFLSLRRTYGVIKPLLDAERKASR